MKVTIEESNAEEKQKFPYAMLDCEGGLWGFSKEGEAAFYIEKGELVGWARDLDEVRYFRAPFIPFTGKITLDFGE